MAKPNPELGPYFRVPKGVMVNGIAGRIGPAALAVYVALCEHANRRNGNIVHVSDKTLAADTRVAERTIREARTKLLVEKLISFTREPGQSYTYTLLLVPDVWTPVEKRYRKPKMPRALHATMRSASVDPPADFAAPLR